MNGAFVVGMLIVLFAAGPPDHPRFWVVLAGTFLMVIGVQV